MPNQSATPASTPLETREALAKRLKAGVATKKGEDGLAQEVAQLRQEVGALTELVISMNSVMLSLLAAAPPDFLGTEEATMPTQSAKPSVAPRQQTL